MSPPDNCDVTPPFEEWPDWLQDMAERHNARDAAEYLRVTEERQAYERDLAAKKRAEDAARLDAQADRLRAARASMSLSGYLAEVRAVVGFSLAPETQRAATAEWYETRRQLAPRKEQNARVWGQAPTTSRWGRGRSAGGSDENT